MKTKEELYGGDGAPAMAKDEANELFRYSDQTWLQQVAPFRTGYCTRECFLDLSLAGLKPTWV
jgi:hypothetical protein